MRFRAGSVKWRVSSDTRAKEKGRLLAADGLGERWAWLTHRLQEELFPAYWRSVGFCGDAGGVDCAEADSNEFVIN
jgi:hypothetical protein